MRSSLKRDREREQHLSLSRCRSSMKNTDKGSEGERGLATRKNRNKVKKKAMRVPEKKRGERSPVRGPSRILNKYIIMPTVPSACFPTLSVVVSRVPAAFFHPPRKNRSR